MKNKYWIKKGISFLMLVVVFSLASCVTTKKKGEVSKIGKLWHNTTAHYNGYFNANELMEASVLQMQEQHQDNYNEILSIYPQYKIAKPESYAEDLNKAIEKVSVVAVRHEPSKWVDDCYIVIGKAQFLQQDYETAEETFTYFIEEFDPSVTRRKKSKKKKKKSTSSKKKKKKSKKKKPKKKKKKSKKKKSKKKSSKKKTVKKKKETAAEKKIRMEKEAEEREIKRKAEKKLEESVEVDRGSNGVFKHISAFPEGLLWLAKTYVERQKYNLVPFYLNKINEQAEVPNHVLKEIPVVLAYNAMEQEEYADAIAFLEEAIPLEKEKKQRARLLYIQSQLHRKVGNNQAAFAGFNKVTKMRPDFLMEFNASLNMLKNSMGEGDASIASVERKLEGMLKEAKFDQFQDQIYFTLGEINYERKDIDKAIPNFRKAIQATKGNSTQLVESYYVLANIFYDKEDYVLSKNYYDSTATVITKADDRYFEVQAFAQNLVEIAKNIQIVELQDSLIRLADMTEDERAEIATQLKKEALIAEAKAKKDDEDEPVQIGKVSKLPGTRLGGRQSSWVFYDENKVEDGIREFKRYWGSRNLQDNWRVSSKANEFDDFANIDAADDVDITQDEINEMLKDVPLTQDALTESKRKIRFALFDLGVLYRERIENYKKAIESHESLQTRFPGSEKEPDALYYLYLSHLDVNDNQRAQYYLNQLKTKYPTEKYTLALTDPSYVENFLKETKIQENMYNEAYAKFEQRDYTSVLSMSKSAEQKFTDKNTYGSKYALLSAMSLGKLEGKTEYIKALKDMIATYPNTDEQTRAKEILRFLSGDEEAFAEIDEGEAVQDFAENDEKLHYVIIVVRAKKDSDLNAAKISISNYNRKYHKVDRIKTSSSTMSKDNNVHVVLLRKFDNKSKAMKYYEEVTRNKKEFMEPKVNYDVYAITQQNFREIMKKKSAKEYAVFFKEKYLK